MILYQVNFHILIFQYYYYKWCLQLQVLWDVNCLSFWFYETQWHQVSNIHSEHLYRVSHKTCPTLFLLITQPSEHLEIKSWTFLNSSLYSLFENVQDLSKPIRIGRDISVWMWRGNLKYQIKCAYIIVIFYFRYENIKQQIFHNDD